MSTTNLSEAQRQALDHVAKTQGRNWKRVLMSVWKGDTPSVAKDLAMANCLHVLRDPDVFGPKGLKEYQYTPKASPWST